MDEAQVLGELLVAIRLAHSRLDASSRWTETLEQIGNAVEAWVGARRLRLERRRWARPAPEVSERLPESRRASGQ
jgi:hypothetical protein